MFGRLLKGREYTLMRARQSNRECAALKACGYKIHLRYLYFNCLGSVGRYSSRSWCCRTFFFSRISKSPV